MFIYYQDIFPEWLKVTVFVGVIILLIGTMATCIAMDAMKTLTCFMVAFVVAVSVIGTMASNEVEKRKEEWRNQTVIFFSERYGLPKSYFEDLPSLAGAKPGANYKSEEFKLGNDSSGYANAFVKISENGEISIFQGEEKMVKLEPKES